MYSVIAQIGGTYKKAGQRSESLESLSHGAHEPIPGNREIRRGMQEVLWRRYASDSGTNQTSIAGHYWETSRAEGRFYGQSSD